ncbi:HAMP domain-containing protein [Corynebacterium sp. zg912]|uniref:histidine kinase n=1 Tax=Corynebacterium wankanglinii TaxID=2735136 RepID=A0A7V9A2C8_9CORY|nr:MULTISPECIES: HAMP domain-containing sensor histidine kinase [Corynebacterium]MBA1838101.1 HAMP domain-containing histidine kinase [Corynebacterium wankanglinii]MCR5929425.1 HAMP domain-containing protein [Corynebacterium sp. zg912]
MPYSVLSAPSKKPLKRQLVAAVMVASTLGIALSSVLISTVMRHFLFDRADDQLREGLATWAQQTPAWQFNFLSLPSEFHQATLYPGHEQLVPRRGTANPPDYSRVKRLDTPTTITSVEGSETGMRWRAMAHAEPDGTVQYVAKSLEAEGKMLRALAWVEAGVGVLALLGIAVAANYMVARALAPLKIVENTALAIANGDTDRRVPAWSRETEVGSLSFAMNTMVSRLQDSLENAKTQEEQMRRFVGDASHELRTPLTSVRGYTELYRKGMANDPEMVLSKIDEESARMQLLVEDLLALTRAEGARLNTKPTDVLELVLSAKSTVDAAFPDRRVEVIADTPDVAQVNGDPDRLHQVLVNLITNAYKHAGPDAEVTVTVRHNLDRVVIDVADNGCGMEPRDAEHIFERFYRADSSRNRATGGSGLGLAITKSLVEAHGGTVSVTTAPGEGSTFTISIPSL